MRAKIASQMIYIYTPSRLRPRIKKINLVFKLGHGAGEAIFTPASPSGCFHCDGWLWTNQAQARRAEVQSHNRGIPMSWHKVTLPFKDCGVNGKGSQLRDAFGVILVAKGGRPFDAAVFSQTSDDHESVYFYFSPAACQLAPALVEQFHAVPCPGPPFLGNLVSLEVGDARSWDLLGVNKPAGLS